MKRTFDFLDFVIIFASGILFSAIISAAIYSLGAPRIIIVMAISLLVTAAAAFSSYKLGRRRSKIEALIAFNKGIERGRTIGRAEIANERQRFIKFNK